MKTSNAVYIIKLIRKYDKMINKLEDALGGVVLEEFGVIESDIVNILEDESGKMWDEDIYDLIYNDDKSPEEVWRVINHLE